MRLAVVVAIALGVGETFAFLPPALRRTGLKTRTPESGLGLTAMQVRKLGPGAREGSKCVM